MLARLFTLLATGEAGLIKRRVKTAAVAYAIVGAALLAMVVFLVLAGYLAAAARWGPVAAAFGFAGGFAVVAAFTAVVHRLVVGAQRRARRRRRAADASLLAGASIASVLPTVLGRRSGGIALLGVLAGLLAFAGYRELNRNQDDNSEED